MIRIIITLLFIIPMAAFGQGSVRRFSSISSMVQANPFASAVSGKLTAEVVGYYQAGDAGGNARMVDWYASSNLETNMGNVFASPFGGQWVFRDRSSTIQNLSWWGAINDYDDDTESIRSCAEFIQKSGGGSISGTGRFIVSTNGPVAVFTNLSFVKIDVRGEFSTDDLGDDSFTSVSLTNTGSTATATWSSPHGLAAGRVFVIKSSTDEAFDGVWTVAASNSPTVLTFTLTAYATPAGPASAIARDSDIGRALFRFDGCTNVDVGNLVFRGVEHPRDIQYRLGYRVIEVRKGTTKVRGSLTVSGASYGWYSGEYAVSSLGGCTDFDVRVWAQSVGYPISLAGSGHDSRFDVFGENLHRGAYLGAVKRSVVNLWIKNWDVAGAIVNQLGPAADNYGSEDLSVRVYDTGTTEPIALDAVGGTRYLCTISGYASTNEVRHRNLDIKVFGKNLIQTSGLLVQTVSSNHWIDGLTFGGVLDQSGIAFTNARTPLFIYATTPDDTAGQFRDVVLRDWKFIAPADADGSMSAWVVLSHARNDVVFDSYQSIGVDTTIGLPPGIHAVTYPRLPDWDHASFESAQVQRVRGGVKLSAAKTIVPMNGSLGTNDFTLQWVGDVPPGNAGLFSVTTGSASTSGSFGASITNGDLIVRSYGSTASDWSGVTATNWANGIRGKVVSLGVVKTSSGLQLFTDGHTTAGITTTSGTPPAWTDAMIGTNAYVGIDDASSKYWGSIYRFAVWNYDRSDQFPALAVRWDAGSGSSGSGTYTVGSSVGNGGFETLGSGGADVFSSWIESTAGSSQISASTNSVQGTRSLAMSVDGSASFAGITSSESMVDGASYEITFWARIPGGSSGQIALVGAAGGDYPISISGVWSRYSRILIWNSTTFSIKRWSLTGQTAEIDDVTVRRVGTLCDFDWTTSPADQVTGSYSSPLGGAATRVNSRGLGVSQDRGDNSVSLESGQDAPVQVWSSSITGPRTVTLQTNHSRRGDTFRIVRRDAGSGTLAIVPVPAVSIKTNQWVDVVFGGSTWSVSAYGSLSFGSGSGLDSDLLDGLDGSYFLNRSNHFGTQPYTTVTGLGQLATVDDAPIDGLPYGRKNGSWSQVVDSTHTHTVSNITGLGPLATSDAPTNGLSYGRNNGAWSQVADAFHTHDASDTVTGEFDPGLLGTGTADTDTFLSGGGGGSQSWRQVLTNDVGGLSGWMATKSDTGHTHAASNIVSGTFAAERLGTGTATTNTFLQGNGSNPPFWGTIPSTPSPTNGIADAPADGVFYGRKNNSWTQPDVSDLSGISSWGMSWIDGTVVDDVDALTTLTLVGGSPSTIESPARYSVRVNSGGSPSIRHRLNLIASGGLSLSLSDDGVNDESDTTISIQDGGITTNKVASTFHQWIYDKTLSLHGTVIDEPNITDTATVEVTAAGPNIAFTVPNDSITYSKLQNVSATNRVLGLGSTAPGNATELAVGDGLITTTTDLRVNIEAGSGIEFATNGSKKITIASKGYTPANDAVANLLLVTSSETEDNNSDSTFRNVTPSARSGMSTTIPAGTLLSGSVMKIEIAGEMDVASSEWDPEIRVVLDGPTGTDYTINLVMNEPGSSFPEDTTTWKAEILIVINSAGSPATIYQRSHVLYADGSMAGSGSLAGYALMTSGVPSNSLNTAADNTIRIDYRGTSSGTFPTAMESFKVSSVIIWML